MPQFHKVFLAFEDQPQRTDFAKAVASPTDRSLQLDEPLGEALADDVLTLTLIWALVEHEAIKEFTKEAVKTLFEAVKGIFARRKKPAAEILVPQIKKIPVEIRIGDRIFRFIYDVETGDYEVAELK